MNYTNGQFTGAQGAAIYYQAWLPEGDVKAAILLVHGLGEHASRYTHLIGHLTLLGYSVYAIDHIGHGKSEGTRKHIDRFSDFTDSLHTFFERVKQWHGDKPLFLLGHSMGGLISAHYLLTHQQSFAGAILSAPALKISDDVPWLKVMLGKLFAVITPKMGILPVNPSKVSRDPEVVTAYMNDPLIHKGMASVRLASELLKAMQRVHAGAKQITLPLLILQGTNDAIVHPEGAQEFYDEVGSVDKTLKLYDGLYHEVFNEPEKEQVLDDLKKWLAAH